MKKIFILTIMVAMLTGFAMADYMIKTKTHMDGFEMMGQKQPATDEEAVNWIGKDKMVTHQQQKTYIIRLDKSKLYFISHGSKTYVEAELPFDLSTLIPAEAASMMNMMKMTVTVTPTGNSKKIKEWNCNEYNVQMKMMMGTMNMTMWTTTDIKINWENYSKMYNYVNTLAFMENPEEFSKLKGYPVLTKMTMNVMGTAINGSTEVIEVKQLEPPAGTYDPPAGYTQKDKMSLQDMR